ncbi:MAG: hypothetical protein ACRDJK_04585, partial [Actinomycetota bacterium]
PDTGPAGERLLRLPVGRRLRPGVHQALHLLPLPGERHEWAKRQATKQGIAFTSLANGFASTDEPARLPGICDRLGPNQILAFFERWMAVIPTPLAPSDRAAGYWWELSMRQVEVSRTVVFDAPRRGRAFFESVVADNLGIGRPSEVRLIFGRQIRSNTKGTFRTRVVTRGTDVTLDVNYRDSRIKEYLKEPGASHRDRRQRTRRPRLPTAPTEPRRAAGQGPRRQSPPP